MDAFSSNYSEARAKFTEAVAARGGISRAYRHHLVGPNGEPLFVDTAWFGPAAASRVLVTLSGVHGVEGFFGSAVQLEWMRRDEQLRLPKDTAVLLIHAVNPYGFAWLRRTNEDNIDLNRNWVDFNDVNNNLDYERIAEDLCPRDWSPETQASTGARLLSIIKEMGMSWYLQTVTQGQWKYRNGLFYGGAAPSWSRVTLTNILQDELVKARRVITLDFHTGLGPYGYVEPIIHRERSDTAFDRTRAWIGASATSLFGGESASAEIQGDGLSMFPRLLPDATVDAVSLECGTVPVEQVAQALRADNWLHAHGDLYSPEAAQIKRQIRGAFYSDELLWQGMAMGQGLAACRSALGGLALPAK